MTPAAFAEQKRKLLELAAGVVGFELDEVLETITRAELAAPLLEDESWELWENGGGDELEAFKRLARSLRPFRDEVLAQLARRRESAA